MSLAKIDGLLCDDVGGIHGQWPWLYLDGDEEWTDVYRRLRDTCPVGVIIPTKAVLEAFKQAWTRAGCPDLVVILTEPGLL